MRLRLQSGARGGPSSALMQPVVARLERELNAILNSPDMRARLSEPALGLTPNPLPADKFLEFIQNEMRVWSPVIKAGNIKFD